MKKYNSVTCVLSLARALPMHELPLENRTDRWWDMFWHAVAVDKAMQLKRSL